MKKQEMVDIGLRNAMQPALKSGRRRAWGSIALRALAIHEHFSLPETAVDDDLGS
jgi:hypothetical protein